MACRPAIVLLNEASVRADAGDVVGAACFVKEAVRRSLRNLCDANGCTPVMRTPGRMIAALARAGVIGRSRRKSLRKLVRVCDQASRLYHLRPSRIKRAITLAMLVETPGVTELAVA